MLDVCSIGKEVELSGYFFPYSIDRLAIERLLSNFVRRKEQSVSLNYFMGGGGFSNIDIHRRLLNVYMGQTVYVNTINAFFY